MAINNVSMEQQIGMLTGVTEITRNASSASRGLVMISSRLTQVLDDSSSTGKKLTKIYEDLDIKLKDENGQLRSHYEILGDLAEKWNALSENEQKYIALTSAGARQQQNFVALMENWSQVADATIKAYGSLGSAQRENEKVMDSIAKKVEILKSQFQQLVLEGGKLQGVAKGLLNIGISVLKFLNSDIGKFTVALVALEVATISLTKNWGALIATLKATGIGRLITEVIALKNGQMLAATSALALKIAQEGLAKALWETAAAYLASPMGMATVAVAAIAALAYATYKWANRLSDANKELQKLSEESKNAQSELDNLNNSLKETQEQIENINKRKLEITDENELANLEKQTKELKNQESNLKRQIILQREKLDLAQREAEVQAKKTLDTHTVSQFKKIEYNDNTDPTAMGSGAGAAGSSYVQVTPKEELQLAIDKYKELKQEKTSLEQITQHEISLNNTNSDTYKKASESLNSLDEEMNNVSARGIEMKEIILNAAENITSMDAASQKEKESLLALADEFDNIIGYSEELSDGQEKTAEEMEAEAEAAEQLAQEIEKLAESLGITKTELQGLQEFFGSSDSLANYLNQLAEIKQTLDDTSTVIDNLQDAMTTAQSVLDEYTETGYLTVDAFQSLMGISAQYLTALVNENGQLEINQTTLGNLVEKLKKTKVNELQAAETADLLAYANGDVADMSALAQSAVAQAGASAANAGAQAAQGASGFWTLAEAISAANSAATGKKQVVNNTGIQKIHNAYSKLAKEISNVKVETSKAGQEASKAGSNAKKAGSAAKSAGSAGASAAKQAKDATKDLNSELEKTKSNYEKVISWIGKQYDKEIDGIRKAKDEAVKAVEEEIKAKEKEKDKALNYIEEEIKALEKQKDAREKYWDKQIDALKKANDERKDALELQEKLDALERAKNTKVKIYKEGQGFVYDIDRTEVAKAQKELDEYLSEKAYEEKLARLEALKDAEMENYNKRIDAYNNFKDKVEKAYEEEINALEEHKNNLEEQYDAEIEMYENYKQQFEDMVNAYEEQQMKLLFTQLTGIDAENKNWMTRLDNLQHFVDEYNRLQAQLDTGNYAGGGGGADTGGGGGGGDTGSSSTTTTTTNNNGSTVKGYIGTTNIPSGVGGIQSGTVTGTVTYTSSQNKTAYVPTSVANQMGGKSGTIQVKKHASGIGSISNDEIAIVGENPNKEIVIGSKINNGELMSLGKGTGVVNADSSKTLAGMLNEVGQFGSSGFGSGNGTLNNNINNDSLVVNGVTIQGSNIKDPETFVNGLLNLKAEALQRAYRHR